MSARFRPGFALALLGLTLPLLATRGAAAQDRGEPDPDALGTHQKNVRLELGMRTQFVSNQGFDPFSENDVLPQVTLGGSWAFYANDALSVAVLAGMDYGSTSASARDNPTSLQALRFTLGPEARYHVLRILAVTAKVAPTLTRQAAEIDTGIDPDLRTVRWRPGFDATAGAALELYGYRSGTSRKPRLWVTAEGGYGWTAPHALVFRPDEANDAPQRLTPLDLGELSLSGPLFRITAALSFW
jgi:hypothetical protein